MDFSEDCCTIKKGSARANLLKKCQLIVWNECSMANKSHVEALDRSLKDLMDNDLIMGGKIIIFSEDFRQILPVVPRGTPADELNASLKASYLWRRVITSRLGTNMRVRLQGDYEAERFSAQLMTLGEGRLPTDANEFISFPPYFVNIVQTLEELKKCRFPNICHHFTDPVWLCERAILATRNS